MTFRLCEEREIDRGRFPSTLRQWQSVPAGRWWIHLNRMLYGIRLFVGRAGPRGEADGYEWDVCLGLNRFAVLAVPLVVIRALRDLPEDAPASDVRGLLPAQRVKPIDRDRDCWVALCRLAGVEVEPVDLSTGVER
jgi:hypothetical protein